MGRVELSFAQPTGSRHESRVDLFARQVQLDLPRDVIAHGRRKIRSVDAHDTVQFGQTSHYLLFSLVATLSYNELLSTREDPGQPLPNPHCAWLGNPIFWLDRSYKDSRRLLAN